MSKKTKQLNQYARHNLTVLNPIMIATLKREIWRDAGTSLLRCISCGKYAITGPVVRFYDFNGAKLRCYACQRAQHVSQSRMPVAIGDIIAKEFNY